PAKPAPVVATEELEALLEASKAPKPPESKGVMRPARARESKVLLVIMLIGFLLAGEITAIAFWKPLKLYLHKNYPAMARLLDDHHAGKPATRRSPHHRR
ncbi:MAG TPA: hypothetical protein V6C72_02300, partial [Chroococcales cyanobacterium]